MKIHYHSADYPQWKLELPPNKHKPARTRSLKGKANHFDSWFPPIAKLHSRENATSFLIFVSLIQMTNQKKKKIHDKKAHHGESMPPIQDSAWSIQHGDIKISNQK